MNVARPIAELTDAEFQERAALIRATRQEPMLVFSRIGNLHIGPTRWLVKDLFEADALACDFGASGSTKSFRAVDVACCVATGLDYHGNTVKSPGAVLYVCGEGHGGMMRRFRAWSIAHEVDLLEIPVFLSDRAVQFGDPSALSPVLDDAARIAAEDGPIRLVVVDTLSRCLAGDENSSTDVPAFVAALDRLRADLGGPTVLVIHHTGHTNTQRSRGHSAFNAALDRSYRIEFDTVSGVTNVICTKSKDTAFPPPMAFKLRTVDLGITDEDGKSETSAVMQSTDYEEPTPGRPLGKVESHALRILEAEIVKHERNVVASGRDADEAHVAVATWSAACKERSIDKYAFRRVKRSLSLKKAVQFEGVYVSVVGGGGGCWGVPIGTHPPTTTTTVILTPTNNYLTTTGTPTGTTTMTVITRYGEEDELGIF